MVLNLPDPHVGNIVLKCKSGDSVAVSSVGFSVSEDVDCERER